MADTTPMHAHLASAALVELLGQIWVDCQPNAAVLHQGGQLQPCQLVQHLQGAGAQHNSRSIRRAAHAGGPA